MADRLKNAAAWLEGQRLAHMASPGTYGRGESSVQVQATAAKTDVEQADAMGFTLESEIRDFLIGVGELVIDDASIEPEKDDWLEIELNGRTERYIVCEVGDEVWRYSDPYRNRYRIHVRRTGTA